MKMTGNFALHESLCCNVYKMLPFLFALMCMFVCDIVGVISFQKCTTHSPYYTPVSDLVIYK